MIVRSRVDPIREGWRRVDADHNATIAELAALVDLPHESLRPLMQATINGHLIYRRYWQATKPFVGTPEHPIIVDFQVPLMGRRGGGGGGAGKILTSVAAIALLGASFLAPGGFFAVGGLFKAGSLSAKLLGAGFAIAGSLLMQNLQRPKSENAPAVKQLGFAGANNDFAPGSGLQRVIGTHRVFPKLVVPPYTEVDGDDQFVTAVYGLAGYHVVTDIRLGERDIETAADVEFQLRDGAEGDTNLTLVTDTRIEEPVSIQMSEWKTDDTDTSEGEVAILGDLEDAEPYFHGVASKQTPDAFKFEFVFGSGLAYRDPEDGVESGGVGFRFRMRRDGQEEWINLPDIVAVDWRDNRGVRLTFEIQWVSAYPVGAGNDWRVALGGDNVSAGRGWQHLVTVPIGSSTFATPTGASGYTQWRWEGSKVILYLLTASYPKDRYEFEIKRGWPFKYLHWGSLIGTPNPDLFTPTDIGGGDYTIPYNPATVVDDVALASVQSIYDEYPIEEGGNPVWLLAVRAKNRQLDRISCIATGVLDIEDTGVFPLQVFSVPPVTSNPAVWYYHVLRGRHNAEPVPLSLTNTADLNEWYIWCESNGKSVNAVIEGKSVFEVLQLIALCGWASPRFGAQHSVVIDRIREDGPIGVITERNATRFGVSKPFPLRPHALRVVFNDSARNYEPREITVYDEGYSVDGAGATEEATRFESVTYEGLVTENLAQDRADHDLRWARHRSTLHHFTQDIEHLEFQKGDLVLLEHDILGTAGRRARVNEIEVSSLDEVHSITVDEVVHFGDAEGSVFGQDWFDMDIFGSGGPKHISMRLADGTIRTEEVKYSTPDRKILEFVTPFVMPRSAGRDLIEIGTLIASGPSTQVARPVLIWDILPGQDMTASIIAVDYEATSMYLFEGGSLDFSVAANSQYIPMVF